MMFLNSKGQAFSVFKLLIAAVVALFILGILLSLLQGITGFQQNKPDEQAASKLKSLVNKLGTPEKTQKVTWAKESSINRKTVADATGQIGKDQVCLSLGDFPEDGKFEEIGAPVTTAIRYTGSSNFDTTITVACDSTPDDLDGTLEDYEYIGTNGKWEDSGFDAASCCDDENDRCCVVAITKT